MMKKLMMLLVLFSMCGTLAHSQNYIPKYKRKKEVRDYDLAKPDRKWEISLGGSCNFAVGQNDRIKFTEQDYTTRYDVKPRLMGSNVTLAASYKVTDHINTGLESGVLFQGNGVAMPLYGTFSYYYGQPTMQQRYRWYNYVHLGPQIYFDSNSKTIGSVAGVGGGLRFLARKTVRFELYGGYQINTRRPNVSHKGAYDLPNKYVDFKQYTHIMQIGLKMYIL